MQVYCFYILDTARGGCRDTDRSLHVSLSRFVSYTISPHLLPNPVPGESSLLLSKATRPSCQHGSPSSRKASLMLLRPSAHTSRLWPTAGLAGSLQIRGRQKGTPPWVCTVWTPGKGTARPPSILTCQCLVTAFHTPIRPVWLVAMSWFPTKNKASTGTPRWKTPAEGKGRSVGTPLHGVEEGWQEEFRGPEDSVGHGTLIG